MENESQRGIITEAEKQRVRRVTDIAEVREWCKKNYEEQESDPLLVAAKIEQICRNVKSKIVWGVYGPTGGLEKIADKIGTIEQLKPEDGRDFKALYMMGLQEIPQNFGDTLEEVRTMPIRVFQKRMENNYVTGVSFEYEDKKGKTKKKLVGTATVMRGQGTQSHMATFRTLYVDPVHRGKGIARELMKERIEYAIKEGIEKVNMIVTASNKHVIEANKRVGFIPTRIQYDAAKLVRPNEYGKPEEVYFDWQHMELDIQKYARDNDVNVEALRKAKK